MNEVVIRTLNQLYRKQLLLLSDDSINDEITLQLAKDSEQCSHVKAKCCSGGKKGTDKLSTEIMQNNLCNILHAFHHILSCRECDEKDIFASLRCGTHDCGCQVPSEDDLFKTIVSNEDGAGVRVSEISQTRIIKSNTYCSEEAYPFQENPINDSEINNVPTHAHALDCLDIAMRWLERQEECNSQTLLALKHLRDLAATKKYSELKLKSIVDFVKKQM